MNVYVITCEYVPVMSGYASVPDDSIHVIAPNEEDALYEAKRHVNNRPLYPLSTFTPTNFRIVSAKTIEED